MDDLISRAALLAEMRRSGKAAYIVVQDAPAVDAVEVSEIKAYLQSKFDEWNALGDRKFEPANMWGYNFIMACFDDLSSYGERREDDGCM